jgi:hypothetical protein
VSWSPCLSVPYHFLTLLLIGKQRPASLIHHGNNRALDLALNGYGVKLLFDLIDPTNRRHLILLLGNSKGALIKRQGSFRHADDGDNLLLALAGILFGIDCQICF